MGPFEFLKQQAVLKAAPQPIYGAPRTFNPSPAPNVPFMPPAQIGPQSIPTQPGMNPVALGPRPEGLMGGMPGWIQQLLQQMQGGRPNMDPRPKGPMPQVVDRLLGRQSGVTQAPVDSHSPAPIRSPGFVEHSRGPQQFGNNLGFSGRMDRQQPMFRGR